MPTMRTRKELVDALSTGKASKDYQRQAALLLEKDKLLMEDLTLRNNGLRRINEEMKRQLEMKEEVIRHGQP